MRDERILGFETRAKVVFFFLGFGALFAQVILIRRLLCSFEGNELVIGALFAGWMLWTGIGSFVSTTIADRIKASSNILRIILLLDIISFLVMLFLSYWLKPLFGYNPGEITGLFGIFFGSFLITAPVCLLVGSAFTFCARWLGRGAKGIALTYVWDTIGACVAGIIFTALVSGRVGIFVQAGFVLFSFLFANALLFDTLRNRVYAVLSTITIVVFFYAISPHLDSVALKIRWKGYKVLEEKESRYGTISVLRKGELKTFFLDGLPAFSYPEKESYEKLVHLAMSQSSKKDNVLLIGGGLAGAFEEIIKYPFKELDYVQIDPELTRLESGWIEEFSKISLDKRVNIFHQDARLYLKKTTKIYNVILLNLADPVSASLNRYYTLEFFKLAKTHLYPNGVLLLSAGSFENYLSDAEAQLLATTTETLKKVFQNVVILPLGRNYILASPEEKLTDEPEKIIARLNELKVETKFVKDYYLIPNLSRERVISIKKRLNDIYNVKTNSDMKPRAYYIGILLWLEQIKPKAKEKIIGLLNLSFYPALVVPALLLIIAGISIRINRQKAMSITSIFSAGFSGIASEIILLMAFQLIYGYVYYLIGLMTSAFMAGLATGALFSTKAKEKIQAEKILVIGILIMLISLLFSLVFSLVLKKATPAGFFSVLIILALLIISAFGSGMIFSSSAEIYYRAVKEKTGQSAGIINGFDYLGSVVSALLLNIFLIPLAGIQIAILVPLVMLGSLLIIFSASKFQSN